MKAVKSTESLINKVSRREDNTLREHIYPVYLWKCKILMSAKPLVNYSSSRFVLQAQKNSFLMDCLLSIKLYDFDKHKLNKEVLINMRTDYGPLPFVVDIHKATTDNNAFRTALWTGSHLQLTLMKIMPGEDIGLEMHPHVDQFLRIEEGQGVVQMGNMRDNLYLQQPVYDDYAIFIPAGTWHNLTNTGLVPIKLYSIYAPPNHPWGTIHQTKAIAEVAESH